MRITRYSPAARFRSATRSRPGGRSPHWRFTIRADLRWVAGALGVAGFDEGPAGDTAIDGVSIDTRDGTGGRLFVALQGERADGHDYLPAAAEGGAAALLVRRDRMGEAVRAVSAIPVLGVADPLAGLQAIARAWLDRVAPLVVAVTGSSGKTGTKELIAAAVSASRRAHATAGNRNNHIGVPLSVLAMPEGTEVLVLEMGASGRGEIAALCRIAPPRIGVITNIGPGHLESFGTLKGVAAAKAELIGSLAGDGTAVLPADDGFIGYLRGKTGSPVVTFGFDEGADVRIEDVRPRDGGGYTCLIGGSPFEIRRFGRHNLLNAAAAAAVARVLDLPAQGVAAAIAGTRAAGGRGVVYDIAGLAVVDESYNSNPASLRAAVDAFMEIPSQGRRWLILGDMLELGAESSALHAEAGIFCGKAGVDGLVTLGRETVELSRTAAEQRKAPADISHFMEPQSLAAYLDARLAAGDAVLVKGSRGMRMETVIDEIERRRGVARRRID
ncbi:MAG: UDP-N-acetylmuramoyl-tripeptide--D-alanyl-D-alanine ligase [Candidatus Krumholzibacteria bacterium]|nr:UDP-N-acetylmuramoyl-tripeptide--D-alanyl-D-alanine ligase [Candidatus Krumholzibacteria bacterium]